MYPTVFRGSSEHARVMFMGSHEGLWAEMRRAYEMIPYVDKMVDKTTPTRVTDDQGAALTTECITTKSVRIDRGGFGVEIQFKNPMPCMLGKNDTVMIELVAPAPKPTPPERVALSYRLAPFGGLTAEEAAAAATQPAARAGAKPAARPGAKAATRPVSATSGSR